MKRARKINPKRRNNILNLDSYFKKKTQVIDRALESYLPKKSSTGSMLYEAMRYAVLSGGKRIRPILAIAAAEAVGGDEKDVLPAACALELIHSYSLVHDDLPCMDNDDERRGQPTCHKKFGEDTALLAGDALLTLAFQILSAPPAKNRTAPRLASQLEAAYGIAQAVGAHGMVGGQAVDMQYQDVDKELATMEYINIHKSGDLIAIALKTGALLGGGSKKQIQDLYDYGKAIGLLFQIVDDILDEEGYSKVLGVPEARVYAQNLLIKAKKKLGSFGAKKETLSRIADFILERTH